MKKTIAIGCDHIVVSLKYQIVNLLKSKGYKVIDCGTFDKDRTHYPIYGQKVGLLVSNKKVDFGIVLCGTGVGIINAVNKTKGIRGVLVHDILTAEAARKEYDANVIGFGGNIVGIGFIENAIDVFSNTKFNKQNMKIKQYMDLLISKEKEISFKTELKKWDKGLYKDN